MREAHRVSALVLVGLLAVTAVLVLHPLRLVGQNAWVSTGGPEGGRIRDLAAGKSGNLFAATCLWRSC